MCEARRGAVVVLQSGDPEISGAIAQGVMEGRERAKRDLIRPASRAAVPTGERLSEGETVDWSEVAKLVRVAVGNTRTADDYMILRSAAEQEYRVRDCGPLGWLAEALLAVYAMAVYHVSRYFDWEGSRWRGN